MPEELAFVSQSLQPLTVAPTIRHELLAPEPQGQTILDDASTVRTHA